MSVAREASSSHGLGLGLDDSENIVSPEQLEYVEDDMDNEEERQFKKDCLLFHKGSAEGDLPAMQRVYAKYASQPSMQRELVENRDYFDNTSLDHAASSNFMNILVFLMEVTADNAVMITNAKNKHGNTALHFATHHGHLEVAKYLINVGKADVNAKNKDGHTPLHFAAEKGHLPIVAYLLEKTRAAVDATNNDGNTPLHKAAAENCLHVVHYLLAVGGASVNALNEKQETPFLVAKKNEALLVMQYLSSPAIAHFSVEAGQLLCDILQCKHAEAADLLLHHKHVVRECVSTVRGDTHLHDALSACLSLQTPSFSPSLSLSPETRDALSQWRYMLERLRAVLCGEKEPSPLSPASSVSVGAPLTVNIHILGDKRSGKSTLIKLLAQTLGSNTNSHTTVSLTRGVARHTIVVPLNQQPSDTVPDKEKEKEKEREEKDSSSVVQYVLHEYEANEALLPIQLPWLSRSHSMYVLLAPLMRTEKDSERERERMKVCSDEEVVERYNYYLSMLSSIVRRKRDACVDWTTSPSPSASSSPLNERTQEENLSFAEAMAAKNDEEHSKAEKFVSSSIPLLTVLNRFSNNAVSAEAITRVHDTLSQTLSQHHSVCELTTDIMSCLSGLFHQAALASSMLCNNTTAGLGSPHYARRNTVRGSTLLSIDTHSHTHLSAVGMAAFAAVTSPTHARTRSSHVGQTLRSSSSALLGVSTIAHALEREQETDFFVPVRGACVMDITNSDNGTHSAHTSVVQSLRPLVCVSLCVPRSHTKYNTSALSPLVSETLSLLDREPLPPLMTRSDYIHTLRRIVEEKSHAARLDPASLTMNTLRETFVEYCASVLEEALRSNGRTMLLRSSSCTSSKPATTLSLPPINTHSTPTNTARTSSAHHTHTPHSAHNTTRTPAETRSAEKPQTPSHRTASAHNRATTSTSTSATTCTSEEVVYTEPWSLCAAVYDDLVHWFTRRGNIAKLLDSNPQILRLRDRQITDKLRETDAARKHALFLLSHTDADTEAQTRTQIGPLSRPSQLGESETALESASQPTRRRSHIAQPTLALITAVDLLQQHGLAVESFPFTQLLHSYAVAVQLPLASHHTAPSISIQTARRDSILRNSLPSIVVPSLLSEALQNSAHISSPSQAKQTHSHTQSEREVWMLSLLPSHTPQQASTQQSSHHTSPTHNTQPPTQTQTNTQTETRPLSLQTQPHCEVARYFRLAHTRTHTDTHTFTAKFFTALLAHVCSVVSQSFVCEMSGEFSDALRLVFETKMRNQQKYDKTISSRVIGNHNNKSPLRESDVSCEDWLHGEEDSVRESDNNNGYFDVLCEVLLYREKEGVVVVVGTSSNTASLQQRTSAHLLGFHLLSFLREILHNAWLDPVLCQGSGAGEWEEFCVGFSHYRERASSAADARNTLTQSLTRFALCEVEAIAVAGVCLRDVLCEDSTDSNVRSGSLCDSDVSSLTRERAKELYFGRVSVPVTDTQSLSTAAAATQRTLTTAAHNTALSHTPLSLSLSVCDAYTRERLSHALAPVLCALSSVCVQSVEDVRRVLRCVLSTRGCEETERRLCAYLLLKQLSIRAHSTQTHHTPLTHDTTLRILSHAHKKNMRLTLSIFEEIITPSVSHTLSQSRPRTHTSTHTSQKDVHNHIRPHTITLEQCLSRPLWCVWREQHVRELESTNDESRERDVCTLPRSHSLTSAQQAHTTVLSLQFLCQVCGRAPHTALSLPLSPLSQNAYTHSFTRSHSTDILSHALIAASQDDSLLSLWESAMQSSHRTSHSASTELTVHTVREMARALRTAHALVSRSHNAKKKASRDSDSDTEKDAHTPRSTHRDISEETSLWQARFEALCQGVVLAESGNGTQKKESVTAPPHTESTLTQTPSETPTTQTETTQPAVSQTAAPSHTQSHTETPIVAVSEAFVTGTQRVSEALLALFPALSIGLVRVRRSKEEESVWACACAREGETSCADEFLKTGRALVRISLRE